LLEIIEKIELELALKNPNPKEYKIYFYTLNDIKKNNTLSSLDKSFLSVGTDASCILSMKSTTIYKEIKNQLIELLGYEVILFEFFKLQNKSFRPEFVTKTRFERPIGINYLKNYIVFYYEPVLDTNLVINDDYYLFFFKYFNVKDRSFTILASKLIHCDAIIKDIRVMCQEMINHNNASDVHIYDQATNFKIYNLNKKNENTIKREGLQTGDIILFTEAENENVLKEYFQIID
jgi:hypothetical protein